VPADVRVMTVHQAKGLEFDLVVLPELECDLVGQPDAFVIDRPDVVGPIRRVCRYANQMIQDLMPPDVQQMFAEATDREVTESLCVLYVALTRAAHALHMIIPPSKPNEKDLSAHVRRIAADRAQRRRAGAAGRRPVPVRGRRLAFAGQPSATALGAPGISAAAEARSARPHPTGGIRGPSASRVGADQSFWTRRRLRPCGSSIC
jgi:hypothetical protein